MITETKQAGMNELSEIELDQITGGNDAIRLIDAILSNIVGTGSEGKGFIGHFLGNGGHYQN